MGVPRMTRTKTRATATISKTWIEAGFLEERTRVQALVRCLTSVSLAVLLWTSAVWAATIELPANGYIDELVCRSKGRVLMEYASNSEVITGETISLVTFGPTIGGSHCFGLWSLRAKLGAFGLAGTDAFSALLLGTEFGWQAEVGGSLFFPSSSTRSLSVFVDFKGERGKAFDPYLAAANSITSPDGARSSGLMRSFTASVLTGGLRGAFNLSEAQGVALGLEGALEHAVSREGTVSDFLKVTSIVSTRLTGLTSGAAVALSLNGNLDLSRNQPSYQFGVGAYDVSRSSFQYGLEVFKIFSSTNSLSLRAVLNFFY